MGLLMVGLQQALSSALASAQRSAEQQQLLATARTALDRMVLFVEVTDRVLSPADGTYQTVLSVSERVLDTYSNATRVYAAAGDGLLDADTDADGLVDEDGSVGPDPREDIVFQLVSGSLVEDRPDYATATLGDTVRVPLITNGLARFDCRRLTNNVVEIRVTLTNRQESVALQTRVRVRRIP
jgi:hypothetical protein